MRNSIPANAIEAYSKKIVSVPKFPHLLKIVYVPERTIFYNACADENANVVILSFSERDVIQL